MNMVVRRIRRPPQPIALTTKSQALYQVALSAVPSPACVPPFSDRRLR